MNNKSARGFSMILLLFLVVIVGVSTYFLFSKDNFIPREIFIGKLETAIHDFCIYPGKLDEMILESRNKGQTKLADFLENLKEKLLCTAITLKNNTTGVIPPQDGDSEDVYGDIPYYMFCDSESQMCTLCWEDLDTGKKICCRKPVADNVPGKDKCTSRDPVVDPSTIPDM